jgi:hypothetical protein
MGHQIRKAHGSPHPFVDFPELQHLQDHEPWLTGPLVHATAVWQDDHDRAHFTCYIVRRIGWKRTLVILMRRGSAIPEYMRLYDRETEARTDSTALRRELRVQPPRVRYAQPDVDGGPWCARVVQRAHHYELQIIRRGLIPHSTRRYPNAEEAELQAMAAAARHHLHR